MPQSNTSTWVWSIVAVVAVLLVLWFIVSAFNGGSSTPGIPNTGGATSTTDMYGNGATSGTSSGAAGNGAGY